MSTEGITRVLTELTADARGAPGTTHHIAIGRGVIDGIAPWLQARHRDRAHAIVCDENTKNAAGDRVRAALAEAGIEAELIVLAPPQDEEHVVCDDATIAELGERLPARVNAIAVGAGTINDIVKMVATHREQPYQCVATAASMNGYTSAIAAVLSKGVKRTLPTQQAQAVFADIDVLRRAPAYLNLAGFGDLLSKPYSNADWKLSSLVRGVTYAERPARLLDEAFELLLAHAEAIGEATPVGVEVLAATIILSGFTMAIAGTSSPASGGEHLVSHYWDMEQHCGHFPLYGLHGTQVGVATRLSALLFERLMQVEPEEIDPAAAAERRADPGWIDQLAALHPRLTPAVIGEVQEQLRQKQKHGAELRAELEDLRRRWGRIKEELAPILMPSRRIEKALTRAGAVDRPSRLGIGHEHAVRTIRVCRHIRGRYVALDLLDDLGLLDEAASDVVSRVERERP